MLSDPVVSGRVGKRQVGLEEYEVRTELVQTIKLIDALCLISFSLYR